MLIDTHCHIHDDDFPINKDEIIDNALSCGVKKYICIGTDVDNSKLAVNFANKTDNSFASIGVHPNSSSLKTIGLESLLPNPKIVAIGEIGLDYHYGDENKDDQKKILKEQIDLAIKYNLPIIFHVREAFDDFWKIIDEYKKDGKSIRGVLHSFSDNEANLDRALKEGFFIGINGLSTYIKNPAMQKLYQSIPIDNIIFETDAPYLTPKPFRGKINQPAYIRDIAKYHADIRGVSVEEIAKITTKNANKLFNLKI